MTVKSTWNVRDQQLLMGTVLGGSRYQGLYGLYTGPQKMYGPLKWSARGRPNHLKASLLWSARYLMSNSVLNALTIKP